MPAWSNRPPTATSATSPSWSTRRATGLRVIYSAHGGIDIEQSGAAQGRLCPPHPGAVGEALAELIAGEPDAWRGHVAAIGRSLAELLIERELALAEINPLFVSASGCVAGDAKLVIDLNAVERQPRIAALIEARPDIYADANRKLREGFDYVELDPDGEIGLVTTGAGLSMMLIDELTARGSEATELLRHPHRPDARQSGTADARAGMDHLAPVAARRAGEHLRRHHRSGRVRRHCSQPRWSRRRAFACRSWRGWSVAVRPSAKRILAERQPGMLVTEDLEEALARIDAIVGGARA